MNTTKKKPYALVGALSFSLILAGCSGPFAVLPGGALEGEASRAPTDWSFIDRIDTIQLETNPADPYSVNIWVIARDDALYVHAGANRATWVENMEAEPKVRLQANESIYELAATRVASQDEFDRFSAAYEEKYGNPPRNRDVSEAYLFRLVAR